MNDKDEKFNPHPDLHRVIYPLRKERWDKFKAWFGRWWVEILIVSMIVVDWMIWG